MPKVVDHKAYRRELLGKARAVFAEKNYADVSMRDIAEALEVSTGTLYHYFPSKEVLFRDLFIHSAQLSVGPLVGHLCTISDRSSRIKHLLDFFRLHCEGMRMQFLFSADMVRNEMPERATLLLRRWSKELNRRLANIVGVDRTTGNLIFCFVSGTIYSRILSGDSTDLAPAFEAFRVMLEKHLEEKNEK